MYSLFSVVGGPLGKVFASALDRKCASATDIVIESDGVAGNAEGNIVMAGSEEYMLRHGVTIPSDDYGSRPSFTDSTRIMYGAENGRVYVKFLIRYSFSEEFTMLLPSLKEEGIIPLIYTRDPNVSDELIKVLTLGEDIIRIMKKSTPAVLEERIYRKVSSGAVTAGSKACTINLVLLAKRYNNFQSHMKINELIAMVAGAVIALAFSLGGVTAFPICALSVLQVIWCIYLYFRTRLAFNPVKTKETDDDR